MSDSNKSFLAGEWDWEGVKSAAASAVPQFDPAEEYYRKCAETAHATIGFPIATTTLLEYKRQLHEVLQLGWRFDLDAGIREEIIQNKVWLCFGLVRDGATRRMPDDLDLEFISIHWPGYELTEGRLAAEEKRQKDLKLPKIAYFGDLHGIKFESFILKEMYPQLKSL